MRSTSALWLGVLSGLSFLSLLMLQSQSVDAQSGGVSSPVANRGQEVWSAEMTVGANGRMLGFTELGGRTSGELSNPTFTWRGTTYTVTNLLYSRAPRSADAWSLVIDVSPGLPLEPNEYGCLALRLGDQWLNLADARGNGRQFFWYEIDLSWGLGDSVEVGLREFPPLFEARSISGWGNNPLEPELGMAGAHLMRRAPVDFEFAMSGTMTDELPDARALSNALHDQDEPTPNAAGATDMLWQWGQFLDHDISLTPSTVASIRTGIPVPQGDPTFDPLGTGLRSLRFNRSLFDPETGSGPDNPREQINLITTFIDASNVYGSSNERIHELRTNDGTGRLKSRNNGRWLPLNPSGLEIDDGGRRQSGLLLAGDIRANEQVVLVAMHTLFVREHNRLAEIIAADHPEMTGHEIFELVRKVVGAQMQVITYQEFLPLLLGPGVLDPYDGYDPEVDPTIANEFSTAAFRFGHTMLSPKLELRDSDGDVEHISLTEGFFNPSMVRERGIDVFLRGVSGQVAQEVDLGLVDEIRNLLFGPLGSAGRDLAALNIQRGRDHGLPGYNVVRRHYGLPPAVGFADISSDPAIQKALESAYENIQDLELWTGGLAEDHMPGAMVGETFHAIIADQFRRLRDGDRFWFENDAYFLANEHLLEELRSTTLADIIRRNTRISDELPDNVFGGPSPTVRVTAAAQRITEGNAAAFTLVRSGPTSSALTLHLELRETGKMLRKELGLRDQVTFEAGRDTVRLSLPTSNDANSECDSTIEVSVAEFEELGHSTDTASARLTVLDDDSIEIGLERGLNRIEWTGQDGVRVLSALTCVGDAGTSGSVTGIYQWDEEAGHWLAFFPGFVEFPGLGELNDLTTLRVGHIYLVTTTQSLTWRIPQSVPPPDAPSQ